MKTATRLGASVMILLLAGWVITPKVAAQEGENIEPAAAFNNNLLPPASSTDIWGVLCPIGTSSLRCRVTDTGGVDDIRFGVCCENKHGPISQCITAPDGGTSAPVLARPGPGEYEAKVFKATPVGNAAGQETYRVDITCLGGGGMVALIQNQ